MFKSSVNVKNKKKQFKHTSSYYRKVKDNLKRIQNASKSLVKENLERPGRSTENYMPNLSNSVEIQQELECNQSDMAVDFNDVTSDELSTSDSEQFNTEKASLSEDLRDWALRNNIKHTALNDLLKTLSSHDIKGLPMDSRTLLNTPKHVEIVQMGAGEYWHNGLENALRKIFPKIEKSFEISISFNIDGLPIYKSSKFQFWPILFLINDMPQSSPNIIGIYYGSGKPSTAELFLTPFVEEVNRILKDGVKFDDHIITIRINCFVCDTPARCFVKGVVHFNHYHGCTKCVVIGEYYRDGKHMSYPRIDAPLRSDKSFRERRDPDHHKEKSPVEMIQSMDMVKDFPIADSLHLIDLGTMKRCLLGWCNGSFNFRTKWSAANIEEISTILQKCNLMRPKEIHRSIRKLDTIKYWKGTEFRTFLLYLGPAVLKDYLPNDAYTHFLMLFSAITICSSQTYLSQYKHVAKDLLLEYIESFINIYGIDSIGSNVHNLCHLIDDVDRFGVLQNISAYPFENMLYQIKLLLRNGNKPLAQAAKRLGERANIVSLEKTNKIYPIVQGEVFSESQPNGQNVFNSIELADGVILSNNIKNKWFLTTSDEIVEMVNVTYFRGEPHICGSSVKVKNDFFTAPFNSSHINIFIANTHQNQPQLYNKSVIKCKLMAVPYHEQLVFMPLLHTLDELNKKPSS